MLFVRTVANERKKFTLFEELIFELKKNSLLCFFFFKKLKNLVNLLLRFISTSIDFNSLLEEEEEKKIIILFLVLLFNQYVSESLLFFLIIFAIVPFISLIRRDVELI